MATYPSEIERMFRELEEAEKKRPENMGKRRQYECDCGRIYYHPDHLIICAENGHK